MNRKSQVTSFIIVGLLLVILIAGGFYLYQRSRGEFGIREISQEVRPVVNYVEDCISEVSREGLVIVGSQAGYYKVPEDKEGGSLIGHSNAIDFFGDSQIYVPYWYYRSANGISRNQMPSLSEIENELSRYIAEHLSECVANFSSFENHDISGFSNIRTRTNIQNDKVLVEVEAPVIISSGEVVQEIEDFKVVINNKLGRTYKKSKEIYEELDEKLFLEKLTYDMLVLYDEIPLTGSEIRCSPRVWEVDKVADNLKEIISNNVGSVRLRERGMTPEEKYLSLDVDSDEHSVSFAHIEDWPLEMDVFPSENGLMKGDVIVDGEASRIISSIFCISNYHFVYDIEYPILVSVLADDGTLFQFGYMVVIENNQERKDTQSISLPEEDDSLCGYEYRNALLNVETISFDSNGNTIDVAGADVYFKCFSTKCDIGKTDVTGYLRTGFPQCINGLISAEKEGYFPGSEIISTNVESSVTLILEKLYDLDFEFKVIDKDTGRISEIEEGDQIIFEIRSSEREGEVVSGVYPKVGDEEIPLGSGEYEFTAYLMKGGESIKLEDYTIRKCIEVPKAGLLGLFLKEEKCFENVVEGGEVENVIVGGAEFEFDVGKSEVANAEKIIIYVMQDDVPKTAEEVNEIYGKLGSYDSNINFLYPEFE